MAEAKYIISIIRKITHICIVQNYLYMSFRPFNFSFLLTSNIYIYKYQLWIVLLFSLFIFGILIWIFVLLSVISFIFLNFFYFVMVGGFCLSKWFQVVRLEIIWLYAVRARLIISIYILFEIRAVVSSGRKQETYSY